MGDLLRLLLREGTLLNNEERFDSARPLFARALEMTLALNGPEHDETHDCMNAVALCDFNRCDYAGALAHYERLMGCMLRRYGRNDDLYRITWENVRRCRALAGALRLRSVAEIVFCTYFTDEIEYARFGNDHAVVVSRGERLDPEGSFVRVGHPVPEYPSSVEHMPGGVGTPGTTRIWTLQTTWTGVDGSRRVERRYRDGSVDTCDDID